VGATGAGLTAGAEENEEGGGFALLALSAQEGTFEVLAFDQGRLEESTDPSFWRKLCGVKSPSAWIALSNPFSFDTGALACGGMRRGPMCLCIGLASGPATGRMLGSFIMEGCSTLVGIGERHACDVRC
jgi:hypothetical protein